MRFSTTTTTDKPARYYVDGVRVSKDRYDFKLSLCEVTGKRYNASGCKTKHLGNGALKCSSWFHYD